MPELILHHYAMSPFSEKIRAMLGYTGLEWASVTVREMPPRPSLEALAGGYRKIPVAQIGADVFCDTRTISREIARLSGKAELALENNPEAVQQFVKDADSRIFLACIMSAGAAGLLYKLYRNTSLLDTFRFLSDRIAMGRKARVKPVGRGEAKRIVKAHVERLENMLETQPFLFGDSPGIADFSAYHGLWYVCELAGNPVARPFPRVSAWLTRMGAFGHGQPSVMSAEEALDLASASTPRPLEDGRDEMLGENVSIAPDDYGREPVVGKLVGSDGNEWVIERESEKTGVVHVHLPREGVSIRRL